MHWLAGTVLLIFAGQPTENVAGKYFTKRGLRFFTSFIPVFSHLCSKKQTHCTYVWWYKDVKEQRDDDVATRLPRLLNLTHMSKTRQVKRTAWFQLLVSRFAYLLLFHTAKNRTQRNRPAKGCEVETRTVARKS